MAKAMFQHSFKLDEIQEKLMMKARTKTKKTIPDFIVIGAHAALECPEKAEKWIKKSAITAVVFFALMGQATAADCKTEMVKYHTTLDNCEVAMFKTTCDGKTVYTPHVINAKDCPDKEFVKFLNCYESIYLPIEQRPQECQ